MYLDKDIAVADIVNKIYVEVDAVKRKSAFVSISRRLC